MTVPDKGREERGVGSALLTGEVVATNVKHLCVLNQTPDLRLLQVVKVVVVGSAQVGAQAAVMASDHDTTSAGLVLLVDSVLNTEASRLDGIVHDGRVLVVTSTAEVDDAVGRQNVLSATGRVLGSTTGNQLGIVIVEEVLVEGQMLLLGEDGIVGLEVVLGQEVIVTDGLDICS